MDTEDLVVGCKYKIRYQYKGQRYVREALMTWLGEEHWNVQSSFWTQYVPDDYILSISEILPQDSLPYFNVRAEQGLLR